MVSSAKIKVFEYFIFHAKKSVNWIKVVGIKDWVNPKANNLEGHYS